MTKQTKAAAEAAQEKIEAARAKSAPVEAPEVETAGAPGQIVLVRGPEDGRRRGGLTFGPVDVEIDLGQISRANFEAIMGDPHLRVRAKPADD